MVVDAPQLARTAAVLTLFLHLTSVLVGAQTVVPDKGFVLVPIPTTADPPGMVFRLDATDVRFDVADLSRKLPRHVADVALPDFTSNRTVEAEAFVRFLTPKAIDLKANVSGNVSFRVRGARKESTEDAEIDRVVRQAFPAGYSRRPGRYFIIRETISATAVDYELSDEMLAGVTAGAQFVAVLRANANLQIASEGGRKLHQTFRTPHRIFYKIEELRFPSGYANAGKPSREPIRSEVFWHAQRAEPGSDLASGIGGLSKIQFLALQQELRDQGCGVTKVDGRYGPAVRRAIATCAKKFNTANNAAALFQAMNVGFGPNDSPPNAGEDITSSQGIPQGDRVGGYEFSIR